MSKQCYVPIFKDWLVTLSLLPSAEAMELINAMARYYLEDEQPPEFRGQLRLVAPIIFPQLDRFKEVSQKRAVAGSKKSEPKKQIEANDQQTETNVKQMETTNTNTNTNTNTSTNTNTISTTNTNTNTNTSGADGKSFADQTVCDETADAVRDGSAVCVSEEERRFELFWEKYPKKQNKLKARAAWNKLSPDTALLERMLTAVEQQSRTSAWQNEGGRYIPSPNSWLNQRRWEDEVTPQPASAPAHTSAYGANSNGSFSTDDFFRAAMRHSMARMEQTEPLPPLPPLPDEPSTPAESVSAAHYAPWESLPNEGGAPWESFPDENYPPGPPPADYWGEDLPF